MVMYSVQQIQHGIPAPDALTMQLKISRKNVPTRREQLTLDVYCDILTVPFLETWSSLLVMQALVGKTSSNLTEFYQVWQGLMDDRLVTRASMGLPKLKLATGETNLTYFNNIYSLMQCTPDMSRQNCSFCLRQSTSYFQSCCHGMEVRERWDLYPFYGSITDAPPPSPTDAPSPTPLTGSSAPPPQLSPDIFHCP